tara:strand:+ start:14709 stop:15152 length:444 start_codon:yes stop_codon:yes gene_type:complete
MEHTEIGEVVKIFNRTVEIRVNPAEDCGACGAKDSCHTGPRLSTDRFVTALDPFGLKVGQRVKINLAPKNLVKASIIVFVLPLLGLLLGAVAGSFASKTAGYWDFLDLGAIIGGFAGIAISVIGLRSYNRKLEKANQYYPAVVEIMQ